MFFLIFVSCEDSTDFIQGEWIENYKLESNFQMYPDKRILSFIGDELNVRSFSFEILRDIEKEKKVKFAIEEDYLIFIHSDKKDSVFINSITADSLDLVSPQSRKIFKKINEYGNASKEEELVDQLKYSKFMFSPKNIEIEFLGENLFITNNLNLDITVNQFWKVESFKDELFLVTDGFLGSILQVKKIERDTITFQSFQIENQEVKFIKLKKESKFNKNDLIGEWVEEIYDLPPLPPEIRGNKKEFFEKENLIFSDSVMKRKRFYKAEKTNYLVSQDSDFLIFLDFWNITYKRNWEIKKLINDTLVIERLKPNKSVKFNSTENVKYIRKK